jgi:hypothetical protein
MPFTNKEDRKAYRKKYFQLNKNHFNEKTREWRKNNRERANLIRRRY